MTKHHWISLFFALGIFVADRAHKYVQIEMQGWRGGEFVTVAPFFDYVLVWNTGISYGLLGDLPITALLVIMGAAFALLTVWWWRAETMIAQIGLAICLGGAASHIIDRWIYGAVPDFFHLHWGDWSFYIFNISDMAITFGVIILILDMLLAGRGQKSPQ